MRTKTPLLLSVLVGIVMLRASSSASSTTSLETDKEQQWVNNHDMMMSSHGTNDVDYENEQEGRLLSEEYKGPPSVVDNNSAAVLGGAAKTLDGRLLCASECAYGIRPPYFRAASYLSGTTAKRISRSINSVFVGETQDGIVVAFRGTIPNSALDWFQNAALLLSPARREDIRGQIHVGFYRAVKALGDPLKKILVDDMLLGSSSNKNKDIYLTGHSKGGAMASIAAILMHKDPQLPNPTKVVTFGSARVGNADFRDYYNSLIQQTTYENHLDLVPFLPPSNTTMQEMDESMMDTVDDILWDKEKTKKKKGYVWGFQPIGNRRFIDENGNIVYKVTKALDDQRIRDFENKTIVRYEAFLSAHRSDCNGGYFQAIAPEVRDTTCTTEEG